MGNNYLILRHKCPIHKQPADNRFTSSKCLKFIFFHIIFNMNNLCIICRNIYNLLLIGTGFAFYYFTLKKMKEKSIITLDRLRVIKSVFVIVYKTV